MTVVTLVHAANYVIHLSQHCVCSLKMFYYWARTVFHHLDDVVIGNTKKRSPSVHRREQRLQSIRNTPQSKNWKWNKKKKLVSPGFEPGTFCVLDRCDNQLHHETIFCWIFLCCQRRSSLRINCSPFTPKCCLVVWDLGECNRRLLHPTIIIIIYPRWRSNILTTVQGRWICNSVFQLTVQLLCSKHQHVFSTPEKEYLLGMCNIPTHVLFFLSLLSEQQSYSWHLKRYEASASNSMQLSRIVSWSQSKYHTDTLVRYLDSDSVLSYGQGIRKFFSLDKEHLVYVSLRDPNDVSEKNVSKQFVSLTTRAGIRKVDFMPSRLLLNHVFRSLQQNLSNYKEHSKQTSLSVFQWMYHIILQQRKSKSQ